MIKNVVFLPSDDTRGGALILMTRVCPVKGGQIKKNIQLINTRVARPGNNALPNVSNSVSFHDPHLARAEIVSFIEFKNTIKQIIFKNVIIKQRLKSEKLMIRVFYKYS